MKRVVSALRACLWLSAAMTVAGCAISQPFPDRATYAPDPGTPEKSPSPSPLILRVMPLRIAKPYDAQLFNYKIGPSQFTQDYYAGFIAPPDRLLGTQLVDWLNDSGAVQHAAPVGTTLDCSANLETNVTAMYADYTSDTLVLEMRIFVIAEASGQTPSRILFQKAYAEKEPLPAKNPAAFITALNAAWRRTLTSIADDLRSLNIAPPPPTQPAER
jgi:uncharacterized lipoprotein YmbA